MSELCLGSFGSLLRSLRTAAGLTQEELAEAARVSYRTISDLERGVSRSPHRDTVRLLAGALGFSVGRADELAALTALLDKAVAPSQLAAGTTMIAAIGGTAGMRLDALDAGD